MKTVKTKDGSFTAFDETLQEHYHSVSGALEEAFEKHVKPLEIEDGMNILDFCFGLGYNSIAAIVGHKNLNITALEIDIQILKLMKEITVPDQIKESYNYFSDLLELGEMTDAYGNYIELIVGDAAAEIKLLPSDHFHRVFFDPFSPQKQPELWSEEVFAELYRILKPEGRLSTYSCAGWIRKNMEKAGLLVSDGPVVGRRSPSTIAQKK